MKTSLTKFCKDYSLAKTTVFNRCKELGMDTSKGVSPTDCDRLLHEFDIAPSEPEPVPIQTTVEVGNHQIVLSTPQLPAAFSLESLRTGKSITFEDPLAVASQFIEVADQISDAMETDLDNRKAKLNQTKQAKDAIAAKAMALKLQQQRYQEKAYRIDSEQSDQTDSLKEALELLQALGK
ncbi:hypothetical protein JOY44_30020 (plasmid) [Phormidium sp. CLA17]|uniref:hypothetical protein n=1 Tax=Leptolyngbya sp. Cla-17 TaxID=2803751 RepID=UPI00149244D8|nr:hypothetical protein [Leptolyngbya sp. Cla-17]MBM0745658.1 hypothetical protein [Leptolyngbya sp. Cla-17]